MQLQLPVRFVSVVTVVIVAAVASVVAVVVVFVSEVLFLENYQIMSIECSKPIDAG